MYKLVVFSALLAVASASVGHGVAYSAPLPYASAHIAAPLINTYAAAPVVQTYSAPALAVGHTITKNVHYASEPVVTGYTSQILKPNLGALATPLATVSQQRVLAPARTVATITPQVTQVHPELTVRKVPVDVPVAHPYVSEVEVRHPAPIVAHAAPVAVAHNVVAAAPVVEARYAAPVAHAGVVGVAGVPAYGYAGLRSAAVW